MSELARLFGALKPYLLREATLEQTVAAAGPVRGDRLAIYRRFVELHERDVLQKVFPATRRAVGPEAFEALREAYFRAHPLSDWELNGNGQHFPAFLMGLHEREPSRAPACACELAALEWADLCAELDPSDVPNGGPWALNPTANLLSFRYDVGAFARDAAATGAPAARENLLLVFRDPATLDGGWIEVDAEDLIVLKMLTEDVPAEAVCAAAGLEAVQLEAWLARAREAGWVVGGAEHA